jgi:hypothetical protein
VADEQDSGVPLDPDPSWSSLKELAMHERIARKLIDRLEDPATQQEEGRLGTLNGKRCCLGVLCDIAVEEGVIPPPVANDDGGLMYENSFFTLPQIVQDWAGVHSENGILPFSFTFEEHGKDSAAPLALTDLNDWAYRDQGAPEYTFPDIAGVIRMFWEEI